MVSVQYAVVCLLICIICYYLGRLTGIRSSRRAATHLLAHCENERQSEEKAILHFFNKKQAHDIRNPLTAMRACAQLGQMRTTCPRAAELFERIMQQIDDLSEMLDHVLPKEWFNLKEKQVVDLKTLVQEEAVAWRQEASAHRVVITLGIQPATAAYIKAEPALIRRALANIIRNALQAMPQGGALDIRLCRAENEAVVTIADTGSGVPAEVAENLFNEFVTTKENGAGLGLSVARQIVNAHGGKLWADARQPRGACFSIALPLFTGGELGGSALPAQPLGNAHVG